MSRAPLPDRTPQRSNGTVPASRNEVPGAHAPASGHWTEDREGELQIVTRALRAIVRNKWIVLAGLALGIMAGLYFHRSMTPIYTAQATVWVDSNEGAEEGGSANPIEAGQLLSSVGWMDLMRSFAVLDPVVDDLGLYVNLSNSEQAPYFQDFQVEDDVRSGGYAVRAEDGAVLLLDPEGEVLERAEAGEPLGASLGFSWTPDPQWLRGQDEPVSFWVQRPREVARGLLQGLDIQMQGTFIRVGLSGANPERTTRIVNGVTDQFISVAEQLQRSKFEERRAILEDQLEFAADNLRQAELALQNFQVQNVTRPSGDGVSGSGVGAGNPDFQSYLQVRLRQEEARQDRLAIERAMGRSAEEGRLATEALEVIPSVQESTDLTNAIELVNEKRAERRALELRYTADHPAVRQVTDDLAELERETVPSLVNSLLTEVRSRESQAGEFMQSAEQELQAVPARAVEQTRLQRAYQNADNLFRELQARVEQARVAAASVVPDVQVLDRASIPEYPSSDPRVRFLALAILAGLGLGLAGAVLRDRLDPILRRPDQVTRELGLPILGTIPYARSRNGRLKPDDQQQVVEAFRNLRLAVAYAWEGDEPMTLTVSSPGVGDGKSFTTSNLALAFAELGHRTLVIDGDVRRGTLHTLFGLERKPGLTDFLAEEATLDEVIQSTGHDTLWAIAGGSRFRDGPELLGSSLMADLLVDVRSRFDRIIIDSPPLGAAVDPFLLGTLAGSILIVLRNGATDQEVATTRLEELRRLPVQILGAALNAVPSGAGAYKYYSYLPGYDVEEPEGRSGRKGERPQLTAGAPT